MTTEHTSDSTPGGAATRLPTTRLGAAGPEVGVQGMGCMGISFAYGPTDEQAARAALEGALERGVTHYDTADAYGAGANERFLAPFVRAHRDEVVIATKCGIVLGEDGSRTLRNDPAYIRRSVEGSLRRLGVDTLDLYYLHRRDTRVPIEEAVGTLGELVAEGAIRHVGLSEVTGDELRAAHAVHPVAALQSEWSVFAREVEHTAVPAARELGVALVPYSPLGRGFLTGAFADAAKELPPGDFRTTQPRYTGANATANRALLEPLRRIAEVHGATPGQVALAWVHARAGVHGLPVVPIPGTRRAERVAENTGAALLDLTGEELAQLEPLAARVAGDRYADMGETATAREEGQGPGSSTAPA